MPIIAQLQTNAWKLEIVGQIKQPPAFLPLSPNTKFDVSGAGDLSAHNRMTSGLEPLAPGAPVEPLLFENTDYDFYLETKRGNAELNMPPTASSRHRVGSIAHFSLNFRNDVGYVDIAIKSDVTGTSVIRLEVFPLKIDYRTDYVQMRDEVAAITRNLVMTAQVRAFGMASAQPAKQPTVVEWLSLARHYFSEMVKAANSIARNPQSRLVKEIENVPVNKAKKVAERALSRLLRKPVSRIGATLPKTNVALPERVPSIRSRVTFDTPENRYIKALMLETRRNLQRLIKTTATGDEDADMNAEEKFFAAARPEARLMLGQVQLMLSAPYLKQVTTVSPVRPKSMVFHHHAHYAAFVRVARLLNGGLALDGGLLQVGVKDIALLYEYWCFLKLMSLLSDRFNLEQQTLVQMRHTKITVTLKKGFQATIKYRERGTGRELLLIYNRLFNQLPTVNQKPDNVIQLASEDNLYIFDAKYRLAYGSAYEKQYNGVGAVVDDINTMHRYRDAIVLPHPAGKGLYKNGIVRGAVVLFPFSDETTYRRHKFYASLSSVDIGGLPFLPQTTSLVEEKLRSVLAANGYP